MKQERRMTLEVSDIKDALNEASKQWKMPVEEIHTEILSTER